MFSYVPHRITPDEANLQDQTAAAARAGDAGGDVDDEEDGRLDVNDARYETGALPSPHSESYHQVLMK
jgi:hypothetical protein